MSENNNGTSIKIPNNVIWFVIAALLGLGNIGQFSYNFSQPPPQAHEHTRYEKLLEAKLDECEDELFKLKYYPDG